MRKLFLCEIRKVNIRKSEDENEIKLSLRFYERLTGFYEKRNHMVMKKSGDIKKTSVVQYDKRFFL